MTPSAPMPFTRLETKNHILSAPPAVSYLIASGDFRVQSAFQFLVAS